LDGEVLVQAAKNVNYLQWCCGIDQSEHVIESAQQKVSEAGVSRKVRFVKGDVLNEECLLKVKKQMNIMGFKPAQLVSSMLFILHDLERPAAEKLLLNHKKYFGNTPLIIAEVFSIPLSVLCAYPNYRPASFQFIHEISGQHLFTKREFHGFLIRCGYRILQEQIHSSIPGLKAGEHLDTIATYVVMPSKIS